MFLTHLQVCRRAERSVVPLVRAEVVDPEVRAVCQHPAAGLHIVPLQLIKLARKQCHMPQELPAGVLQLLCTLALACTKLCYCCCRAAGLQVGVYLNRLSDYLFTAARFAVSTPAAATASSQVCWALTGRTTGRWQLCHSSCMLHGF